jgi:hypothetical protein
VILTFALFQSKPTTTPLSWEQLGPTIVGDAADDFLGISVALSSDASTLVIGALEIKDDTGYVKVYRTNGDGGNRVQLGQTIYGDMTDDFFGQSVDITADGTTIICGSSGPLPGYVRVFSLVGDDDMGTDTWRQIGQDIIGEGSGDYFGTSVSISDDGKTIAVGADGNDGKNGVNSGHVRIYGLEESGTRWEQIGQDIDGEAAYVYSGKSVSLSADGMAVAIGSPYYTDENSQVSGQVKVYRIDNEGSSWERLGQDIYGNNVFDNLGLSVNLSPDGNTLASGSPGSPGHGPGDVKFFSLEGGNNIDTGSWKQIGGDIIGVGGANGDNILGEQFGQSVSISDDGKTVAVGAWLAEGKHGYSTGHVRVYRNDADSESGWMQLGNDIEGEVAGDESGYSVSLSADGNTVAIGSPWNDDNGSLSGHVRVFVLEL